MVTAGGSHDRSTAQGHHARQDGAWIITHVIDPATVMELPQIGISLPLVELYDGVIGPP